MDINNVNIIREKNNSTETTVKNSNKVRQQSQTVESKNKGNAEISKPELLKAVNDSNEIGKLLNRKLSFDIDESTEKIIVKIIDEESGEVVRQIPSEEMMRISSHLKKLLEMNEKVMWAVKSVILDVSA
jgi:flagellar protein FlaG